MIGVETDMMVRADRGYVRPAGRLDSSSANLWEERPAVTDPQHTTKACVVCGIEKLIGEFYVSNPTTGHRQPRCKSCRKSRGTVPRCQIGDPFEDIGPSDSWPVNDLNWSWAYVIYRDIPGFPGYKAGTNGTVWSQWSRGNSPVMTDCWRRLRPRTVEAGYRQLCLRCDRTTFTRRICRLILETFVGPCPEGMQTLHGDGNASNDHLYNLRWGTPTENGSDKERHGTVSRGEHRPSAKLTATQVKEMRRDRANGVAVDELVRRYGISRSHLHEILSGKYWKHVVGMPDPDLIDERDRLLRDNDRLRVRLAELEGGHGNERAV